MPIPLTWGLIGVFAVFHFNFTLCQIIKKKCFSNVLGYTLVVLEML